MDRSVLYLFLIAVLVNPVCLRDSSSSSEEDSSKENGISRTKFGGSSCQNTDCKEKKAVVCYFTNWAWYRSGLAKYRPENIDTTLCTHIIYAFASLDNETLTMVSSDPWADIDNKFFELVTAKKNSELKVMIAIGGWTNSGDDRWSRLISSKSARAKFVSSAVDFLKKYNFDGLDMDYEYPGCPQGNRTAGRPSDAKNFNLLVHELKVAFGEKYVLSAALSAGEKTIKECYDMAGLWPNLDFINLMAYDYTSYLDGETGPNAPFYGTGSSWGTVETVRYYLEELKCPANKIALGIPLYAKTFTMVNSSPAQFGVPVSGAGKAGTYSQSAGTLAYYEVCELIKSGYKYGHSSVNDSYAWNGDQFISYDAPSDIIRKSCLIKYYNLKGAMIWDLDWDDFSNNCGCGKYPLLTTINQQLRCRKTPRVQCY